MANVVSIILKGVDQTRGAFTAPIKDLEDLGEKLAKLQAAALATSVALIGTLAGVTVAAIHNAEKMGLMAEKAGMSVEEFSKLATAAKLSKVDVETLSTSVNKLNKNLVEAASNAGSDAAKAMAAMGINIRTANGELKTNGDIIVEVAGKFATYKDGAEKSALAMAIFGRAGAEMIPLLNEGAETIKQRMADASGVTAEMADQAKQVDVNMMALSAQFSKIGKVIAAEVLPFLVEVSKEFLNFIKNSGAANAIAQTTINVLKGLAYAVYGLYTGFKIAAEFFGGVWAVGIAIVYNSTKTVYDLFIILGKTVADLGQSFWNLIKIVGEVGTVLGKLSVGDFKGAFTSSKEAVSKFGDELVNMGGKFKNAMKDSKDAVASNFKQGWEEAKLITANSIDQIIKDATDLDKVMMKIYGPKSVTVTENTRTGAAPIAGTDNLDKRVDLLRKIADLEASIQASMVDGIARQMAAEDEHYQKRLNEIDRIHDAELKAGISENEATQTNYKLREAAFQEYQKRIGDIQAAESMNRRKFEQALDNEILQAKAQDPSDQGRFAAQIAEFDLRRNQENELYEQKLMHIAQMQLSEDKALLASEKAYTAHSQRMANIDNAQAKQKRQQQNADLSAYASVLGQGAQLAAQFGKKGFAAYQALSIGQALIATYLAANKALAELGPIAGPVVMAATIALGLANVAMIAKQKPPAAHGGLGYVPAEQTYLLQAGERVLSPNQNKDFTDFISGGISGAMKTVQVNVHVAGELISQQIYKMSRDGTLRIDPRAVA